MVLDILNGCGTLWCTHCERKTPITRRGSAVGGAPPCGDEECSTPTPSSLFRAVTGPQTLVRATPRSLEFCGPAASKGKFQVARILRRLSKGKLQTSGFSRITPGSCLKTKRDTEGAYPRCPYWARLKGVRFQPSLAAVLWLTNVDGR